MTVVAYLRQHAVGESHAVTASVLCRAIGIQPTEQGKRIIRGIVHQAVARGELICSGQSGYFVPATREEAESSLGRLTAEARSLRMRAEAARRLVIEKFGQGPPRCPVQGRGALLGLMEAV